LRVEDAERVRDIACKITDGNLDKTKTENVFKAVMDAVIHSFDSDEKMKDKWQAVMKSGEWVR
jgi:hypothetical protein